MCEIDDWITDLRSAQFAGAVAVPEEALATIAAHARGVFHTETPSPHACGCYLLLAFNCAYYDFNEAGFWPHMFKRLGIPKTQEHENRAREALMFSWSRVLGRKMPMRDPQWPYVGAVLEETGIVQNHLPQFATFLGESESGWRQHVESSRARFNARLPRHLGTRLHRYLSDHAGRQFTRNVVRLLLGWREGRWTREALDSAAGFRPGFFRELLRRSDPPRVTPIPGRCPAPRIVFDVSRELPVVLFSGEAIEREECSILEERVWSTVRPLARVAEYRDPLPWRMGERHGELSFWKPSAARPCALFHPKRGFVAHGQRPIAGTHLLLARGDFSPPHELRLLSDFSFAAVEDERLRWWTIEVPGDGALSLPGYENEHGTGAELWLEWEGDGILLDGAADARSVFVQRLPAARLRGADALPEGWHLFAEVDASSCSLGMRTGRLEIDGPLPAPPFRGSIWIEYIGRLRADGAAAQRLDFAVVPRTEIVWPAGLYSPDERPEVAVPGPCEASWENVEKVAADRWRIEPLVSCLEGRLDFGAFSIGVAKAVWRARCVLPDHDGSAFDLAALLGAERIRFSGLPGTEVRVGFAIGREEVIEVLRADEFQTGGTFERTGSVFADALRNWSHPIAAVRLHDGRRWVDTTARVFHSAGIEHWLGEADADDPQPWVGLLNESERVLLHEFHAAIRRAASPPQVPPPVFSSGVRAVLGEFAWMSAVFATLDRNPQELPEEFAGARDAWKSIAGWVRDALPFLRGEKCDEDQIAALRNRGEALDVESLPARLPWGERLREAIKSLVSAKELLVEWDSDVRVQGQIPTSKIAAFPDGLTLTSAWRRWLHFSAPRALGECEQAARSSHFLVRSLALLLRAVIRMPTPQFQTEDAAEPADCPSLLKPYFTGLRTGEPIDIDYILPLPERDLDLIRNGWKRLTCPQ